VSTGPGNTGNLLELKTPTGNTGKLLEFTINFWKFNYTAR
jgi:hypothetical protein